jgi:hypothetical protein
MQNLIRPQRPQTRSTRFAGVRGLGRELGRGRRALRSVTPSHQRFEVRLIRV